MKPWCIERDTISENELDQLQEVVEYFGAGNAAGVEFVTVMYDFCGVDSDGGVDTANETKWFNDNLITYNEAFELMTGLKTLDAWVDSPSITTLDDVSVAELVEMSNLGATFSTDSRGNLNGFYSGMKCNIKDRIEFDLFKEAVTTFEELK